METRCSWSKPVSAEATGRFGALLRRHRIAAGLTQAALADRAGLSVRGIADLERGARRYPHFHTLRCLAVALELSPADRVALVAAGQRPTRSGEADLLTAARRRCVGCGRENAPGAAFCVDCGDPLYVACPACGEAGDPAYRFCHACGASRTPGSGPGRRLSGQDASAGLTASPERVAPGEGEHKQATVLFCQLADAAAMADSVGRVGMLAFLDFMFERADAEVRRFGGTVSSFLGDGMVALFGVPVAHEDHARRGVLAALGLQRRLREGSVPDGRGGRAGLLGMLRMALNTGLVAVSHIGSGPRPGDKHPARHACAGGGRSGAERAAGAE
jgi:transcriptional regulator with XRE-family HTH domain